jgi:uncharacterized repeat protein (TIGR03803 family)
MKYCRRELYQCDCQRGAVADSGASTDVEYGCHTIQSVTGGGGTNNMGTVNEITPAGTETVLYSFGLPVNSYNPSPTGATLVQASDGSLYGVTDAALRYGLVLGADGNLYGTAFLGGANDTGAAYRFSE